MSDKADMMLYLSYFLMVFWQTFFKFLSANFFLVSAIFGIGIVA